MRLRNRENILHPERYKCVYKKLYSGKLYMEVPVTYEETVIVSAFYNISIYQ